MTRSITVAVLLLACLPALAGAQGADSTRIPLTVPGRPAPVDTLPDPGERALEFYRRGVAFEKLGKKEAALFAFQNCVLADRTFPDAYYRLGGLFLDVGNVEKARQCFEAELRNSPKHEQASRELGLALARLGHAKQGLPRLVKYRDAHPAEGLAWYELGYAYMEAGDPAKAERAMEKAVEIGPPNPVWHRDLGAIYAARGADDAARREYAAALEISPTNPTPLINLGNLERRAGHARAALEAYRRAEAIDSTLHFAYNGQALVLRDLGRQDEAAAVYRRWLKKRPGDHGARLEAVKFFQAIALPEQGLQLAREGVERNPKSGDARMVLAIALNGVGKKDEALAELHRAKEMFIVPADRAQVDRLIEQLKSGAADSSAAPGGAAGAPQGAP